MAPVCFLPNRFRHHHSVLRHGNFCLLCPHLGRGLLPDAGSVPQGAPVRLGQPEKLHDAGPDLRCHRRPAGHGHRLHHRQAELLRQAVHRGRLRSDVRCSRHRAGHQLHPGLQLQAAGPHRHRIDSGDRVHLPEHAGSHRVRHHHSAADRQLYRGSLYHLGCRHRLFLPPHHAAHAEKRLLFRHCLLLHQGHHCRQRGHFPSLSPVEAGHQQHLLPV